MIEAYLQKRYPGTGHPQIVREEIANACNTFVNLGLADSNYIQELCSGSEQKFWSRISEALLATRLYKAGVELILSNSGCPDLLVIENKRKIWIEIICPEPIGVPSEWLKIDYDNCHDLPDELILLRWTSAIKEKAEKLLGNPDKAIKGYLNNGIVTLSDAYVIAVNGCQLRSGPFTSFYGISQFPFAVEAVFGVGPYQITINSNTLEKIGTGYQHRPFISKSKGNPVPTYTFLDAKFQAISAIWAVDVNGTSAIGSSEPLAVIHNPKAINPIPINFLPAHDEYVAKSVGNGEYELNRVDGCLI